MNLLRVNRNSGWKLFTTAQWGDFTRQNTRNSLRLFVLKSLESNSPFDDEGGFFAAKRIDKEHDERLVPGARVWHLRRRRYRRFRVLTAVLVRCAQGMSVISGEVIGFVGSTGNADVRRRHLQFAILELRAGKAVVEGGSRCPRNRNGLFPKTHFPFSLLTLIYRAIFKLQIERPPGSELSSPQVSFSVWRNPA